MNETTHVLTMPDAEFSEMMRAQGREEMAARFGHDMPTDEASVDPMTVIDDVLAELRAIEDQLADLDRRKGALREVLNAQLGLTADAPIVRPLATVRVMPGSERVSYDRRALDGLCASMPDLASILSPHRKVTVTVPSVRIEWTKGGAA